VDEDDDDDEEEDENADDEDESIPRHDRVDARGGFKPAKVLASFDVAITYDIIPRKLLLDLTRGEESNQKGRRKQRRNGGTN